MGRHRAFKHDEDDVEVLGARTATRDAASPDVAARHPVADLQSRVGNAAVTKLVQRKGAGKAAKPAGKPKAKDDNGPNPPNENMKKWSNDELWGHAEDYYKSDTRIGYKDATGIYEYLLIERNWGNPRELAQMRLIPAYKKLGNEEKVAFWTAVRDKKLNKYGEPPASQQGD